MTIEASSYDAERIVVASRLGRISLVVRSAADNNRPTTDTSDTASPVVGTSPPDSSETAPIAWAGDVSPALRETSGGRNGGIIRLYDGPGKMGEVKF